MRGLRMWLGGLVILGLLLAAPLAWRAFAQQATAATLRIDTADGIEEARFVPIRGVEQWLQIRGRHRNNPIVLMVHGGPGFAMAPFAPVFLNWENDFTLVQWDQRDAGRTFSRNGPLPISVAEVTADGLAVAEYLHRRLPGAKIIVLGHSWGSAIALNMVHRRPDLFAAFVGTGQLASMPDQETLSSEMVLARLRAAHNAGAAAQLQQVGPAPYRSLAALLVERKWLRSVDTPAERALSSRMLPLLLFAPGQSLKQVWDFTRAPKYAQSTTYGELATFDARSIGQCYRVPMFIFDGDQDLYTPAGPALRFLSQITAPRREFVSLPGGGHDALLTMPDAFLAQLRARVLPLGGEGAPVSPYFTCANAQ